MTYRILVCGPEGYAKAERVRYALSRLFYQMGQVEVFDLGGLGASAGARWYRHARGWEGSSVWAHTALEDVKPDYVLVFGADDRGIAQQARNAGVKVGEVA